MGNEHGNPRKNQSANHGDEVDTRPHGAHLIPNHEEHVAGTDSPQHEPTVERFGDEDISDDQQLSQLTIAQYNQLIENHLHLAPFPITNDQLDVLSTMRERTPEMYDVLIETIRTNVETDSFERKNKFLIPARYATRGQILGLISVLAMLGVVVYAITDGAYWLAGVFGVIDIVALAAVFGANQKPQER